VRIAIIGTGIAGLATARFLHPRHDITVFEADDRVGGHAHTVDVEVDGERHPVDTGFIVYNERNYPGFVALLAELGVSTQPAEMSFGVSDPVAGLEFRLSNLNSMFAQRRNLLKPSFVRLLAEIVRFNRAARTLVDDEPWWRDMGRMTETGAAAGPPDESLADFVRRGGYSKAFVDQFLVPFGASIWSADPATFTEFPARSYAHFMHNHGLLGLNGRPQWRTISGGSRTYVDALVAPFADRIRTAAPVQKVVSRIDSGGSSTVELLSGRGPESFDRVVMACHSDQALRMLGDATPGERSILGAIKYQRNVATLHDDIAVLPRARRARASWNYRVDPSSRRASVTYWMNRLQSIPTARPLLLTLNRGGEIDDRNVFAEFEYQHPVFDGAAVAAQHRRHEIQGLRGIYYAGAYWGYGFHEDGVQSAHDVVAAIGAQR
jgi:predicted NAD/FAD-binding protein